MRRVLWLCFIFGVCSGASKASLSSEISPSSPDLTYFVIENQARPLQIESNGLEHRGIVSDLVLQMSQDLEVPLKVVALPFRRMLLQMKKPANKNWIAYGSPVWQAKNPNSVQSRCLFPEPILDVSHSLVTRADQIKTIDSVDALFDQRLITLHGYNYPVLADYFDRGVIQKLNVKNHHSAFKAVAAKRGLGFVGMDVRVAYSFSEGGVPRAEFRMHDMSFLIPSYPIHLSYGCSMDSELAQRLVERYQVLRQEGLLDELLARYLEPEPSESENQSSH